jgi:hypothetical protein
MIVLIFKFFLLEMIEKIYRNSEFSFVIFFFKSKFLL